MAFSLLNEAKAKVAQISGEKGKLLQKKFNAVMKRNPDIVSLQKISRVLEGEGDDLPIGMSPRDAACFKYCPASNVDVERSFSIYKNVLTDHRRSLTKENIKKIMVSSCYFNRQSSCQPE